MSKTFTAFVLGVSVGIAACTDPVEPPSAEADQPKQAPLTVPPPTCTDCILVPTTFTANIKRQSAPRLSADPRGSYLLFLQADGNPKTTAQVFLNNQKVVLEDEVTAARGAEIRRNIRLTSMSQVSILVKGVAGSTVTLWVRSGLSTVGPAGGSVIAPGSGARFDISAGAVAGELLVQLTDQPPVTPEHQKLSGLSHRLKLDLARTDSIRGGSITVSLPVVSLPPPGMTAGLRGDFPGAPGAPQWQRATINAATMVATATGNARLFVSELNAGNPGEVVMSVEAFGDVSAPLPSVQGAKAQAGGANNSTTVGAVCGPLASFSGYSELVGRNRGDLVAASIWQVPGTPAPISGQAAIVLVHGWQPSITDCTEYLDSQKAERPDRYFAELLALLRSNHLDQSPVLVVDYPTFNDFQFSGRELAESLDLLRQRFGANPVLVGHSMGGLVAREAAHFMTSKPVGIITLATPHLGSPLASQNINLVFWQPGGAPTPGKLSLVSGLQSRQSIATEAQVIAFGASVAFGYRCLDPSCLLVSFYNDGTPPYWQGGGPTHYDYVGGRLCRQYGECTSDAVVPETSAVPSFVVAADRRRYGGNDHSHMKAGFGAPQLDQDLVADISALVTRGNGSAGFVDLAPASVTGPSSARVGDIVAVSVVEANVGGAAVSSAYVNELRLSQDQTCSSSVVDPEVQVFEGAAMAGGSTVATPITGSISQSISPGTYFWCVIVNHPSTVPEFTSANNVRFGGQITITAGSGGGIPSPVAFYPLDGDGVDASGNGNHGTVTNAVAAAGHTGLAGTALAFSGALSMVSVPSNPILKGLTGDLTVVAWVRRGTNPISTGMLPVSRRSGIPIHFELYAQPEGFGFQCCSTSTNVTGVFYHPRGDGLNVLNDGAWHQVAVTRRYGTGGFTELYRDGIYIPARYTSGSPSDPAPSIDAELVIGRQVSVSPGQFEGALDNLYLFNRILTRGQVANLP